VPMREHRGTLPVAAVSEGLADIARHVMGCHVIQ
jgi:hypothetical protein